jgi:hypothetical protein
VRNQKNYLEPIIVSFNSRSPILSITSSFSSMRTSFIFMNYFMELINIGIIWLAIVNAYKHIKIFYAQLKALKVYPNTCNIENSFHLNLGANNPQNVWSYKPNIQKLYHMCSPPFLWIFCLLFHYLTLKWFSFSFTTVDVISSSIFMRSYSLMF